MKHFFTNLIVATIGLVACATPSEQNYLVPREGASISIDVPWQCLRSAQMAEKTRERIYENDRALLRGVDTRRFLWWMSANEVQPLADNMGRPSMHSSSANETYASQELSDHYVLCLLRSGFAWPN